MIIYRDTYPFHAGDIFESKWNHRVMLILEDRDKWLLVADPMLGCGGMMHTDENGKYRYTYDELRERLKDWTLLGQAREIYEEPGMPRPPERRFLEALPQ